MSDRKIAVAGDDLTVLLVGPGLVPLHERWSKRLLDIVGAAVLLVMAAPLMLALALVIRLDGGPAMFRHRRIGANGRPFPCLKFRTMHVNAQEMLRRHLAANPQARAEWEARFKLRDDPRVTRLGSFLRRSSLDELPQLFNVLAGHMSLVGPRPIIRDEIPRYGQHFQLYALCRPGLTGLWQISGRSDVDYDERVELDRRYVSEWSLWNDLRIMLLTPVSLLARSGAY